MLQQREQTDRGDDPGTPWWRRLTALFTLSSLVVVVATIVAFAIGVTTLFMLFILERAIAG